MKKVSVVIPFYNGAEWLCEAVQSVLDQTYKNIEIIVVNDGSPEDVTIFLKKYGDKIIYRFKENGGPASARNLALEIATGDYIAFLDSDDLWLPTKTEKQIAFMEKNNIMWSHTGYYNWYPETNSMDLKNNSWDYGWVYNMLHISVRAQTPAVVVNRKCLLKHPEITFPNQRYGQDFEFFIKIAKYYPLGLLKERLIKVRQRGTNTDLRAEVRIPLKSAKYKDILGNDNINFIIKFIHWIYYIDNKFIEFIKSKFNIRRKTLEYICRIFWVFPYALERIYKVISYFYNKIINSKENKYVE